MRRPTTIRSHLIILVVVATLPLAGLWAYIVFAQFKFRQETAWSMTHQVAQLTAASVRQFFEETRLMLESMASSARDRMFDRSDCTAFLVDASLTAPMYVGFSIVDSEGTVLCTSIPTDVRSIRDREWFELVSRRGTFSVGKPVIGLVSRDWVSVMALPIENSDGGRLGYLSVAADLDRFQQVLNIESMPEEAVTSVSHVDGTIVARSRDPELWVGQQLSISQARFEDLEARERIVPSAEGGSYMWAWEELPEVEWLVYSGLPANWAFRQGFTGMLLGFIAGAALVIAVLLVASDIYRKVSLSLSQLVKGARRAAEKGMPFDETELEEVTAVARQFNETLHERTLVESDLRATMDLYQSVVENAAMGVLVGREDGTIIEANASLADIVGAPSARSLAGRNQEGFFADAAEWENARQVFFNEKGQHVTDTTWLRLDDTEFPVRLSISRINLRDGTPGVVALVEDLSAHQELEAQFRQSQKLESLGRLAGGIAHDFNNRLTVILNCADTLRRHVRAGEADDAVNAIRESATRSADLTKRLLAFSRREVATPRTIDLNAVVADFQEILKRGIAEDVSISISVAKDPCLASVDRGQVEQVILNLATNAGDAMPNGGEIRITTRIETATEQDAAERPDMVPGVYVVLSVADTGIGMDENTKANVFEPFFTTKAPGEGTGLGLSTAYGIIRQNDGHMRVFSEPGAGATFEIWLPRSAGTIRSSDPQTSHSEEDETVHQGTVLVAEDEPSVRNLINSMLERAGYEVLIAEDGAAAIEISRKYEGDIDILVSDWVMPRMRGPDLAKKLLEERPSVKVLYISGYTGEQLGPDRLQFDASQFLAKPFPKNELLKKLRELMGDEESA